MDTEEHLLPYMPYLLQDMWALGSAVDCIRLATIKCKLSENSRILDLGCGKGAVSVQLALEFGCQVTGIDAFEPFLLEAEKKSKAFGVADLCEFLSEDIIEYTSISRSYDLVILASLGGVLGSFRETIKKLRSQVKAGGFIIIDDGYLRTKKRIDRKGYEHYNSYEKTVLDLTSLTDRIVEEIDTTQTSQQINDDYLEMIDKRSKELVAKHPPLKSSLDAYISLQAEECKVLENEINGMLWLVRKTD